MNHLVTHWKAYQLHQLKEGCIFLDVSISLHFQGHFDACLSKVYYDFIKASGFICVVHAHVQSCLTFGRIHRAGDLKSTQI